MHAPDIENDLKMKSVFHWSIIALLYVKSSSIHLCSEEPSLLLYTLLHALASMKNEFKTVGSAMTEHILHEPTITLLEKSKTILL